MKIVLAALAAMFVTLAPAWSQEEVNLKALGTLKNLSTCAAAEEYEARVLLGLSKKSKDPERQEVIKSARVHSDKMVEIIKLTMAFGQKHESELPPAEEVRPELKKNHQEVLLQLLEKTLDDRTGTYRFDAKLRARCGSLVHSIMLDMGSAA